MTEDAIGDPGVLLSLAVPLAMWLVGRYVDKDGRWKQARIGAAIGSCALPLSFVAYSFYWFVPVVGIVVGLPGLLLLIWHLLPFPGAFDELYGAVLQSGKATGAFVLWKPAVLWGVIYALIGAALDVRRKVSAGINVKSIGDEMKLANLRLQLSAANLTVSRRG